MDSAEPSRPPSSRKNGEDQSSASYRLDDQVGFLLRRVTQRHVAIFAAQMGEDITPMRWAVLAKLHEAGPSSQNRLGRSTAMDAATIKGVVDRLMGRGLIETQPDPLDARRRVIALTDAGRQLVEGSIATGLAITHETLAPLTQSERATLLGLLRKLV
jgi:MarR family transcriptional regulator, lower aerobic nicotinate degradation pathway regulator